MRAALVLAAGGSRRFGRIDKLLAPLRGRPLLLHAIDRARESGVRRIYVVVSSPRVRRLAAGSGTSMVFAREATRGPSASLAAGLRALRPIEREVLIFLGDMPFATAPRRLRLSAASNGTRPTWHDKPGHPMLVRVAAARQASLRGDKGLGRMRAIAHVRGKPGNLIDIDSLAALRRARGSRAGSRR